MRPPAEEIKLGSLVTFRGGGTPTTTIADYWDGDIPWVSPKDMKTARINVSEDSITPAAITNSAASLIPENSILVVVRSGILARTVPIARAMRSLAVNQDIKALVPGKRINPEYLHYFLRSAEAELLARVTKGATVHRLSTDSLRSLRVPLPSLSEQQRIVAILDQAFEAIATATANAEKNLANARELFDRHLKRLFEGFEDVKNLTLAKVATTFGRGKSKHRPRNDPALYGGAYPFVQTGDVRNAERYIDTFSQTYNENGLAQSKLWPRGTVCITIAANIAETAILGLDACFPDSIIGMIVDKDRTTNEFVEYLLRYHRKSLKARGKGSAQDNINLATFESHLFPFPRLQQQSALVGTLNELADAVRDLEVSYTRKLAALAELRQSLLARAFSGELTASDAIAA